MINKMRTIKKIIRIISIIIAFCPFVLQAQDMLWVHDTTFRPSVIFTGIDNYDSQNIMMIAQCEGAYRRIIKSTDGGSSWKVLLSDPVDPYSKLKPNVNDIAYPSKNLCVIACEKSVYMRSTDQGITWESDTTGLDSAKVHGFEFVSMCDDKNGVMASRYQMLVTHDGFKTWEQIMPPDDYFIIDVEMISPYTIYCLSLHFDGTFMQDNKFYVSKDGGYSWTEYPHPDYKLASSMKFIDSLYGYICAAVFYKKGWGGQYDRVYRTKDGGKTWEMVLNEYEEDDQPFGLQELDIYDRDNAIFVGQFGKVYRTTDGGDSFIRDPVPEIRERIPPTMNVCMLTPERSIIVDYSGRVFHSEYATGIINNANKDFYSISPNPATDYIELSIPPLERGSGGVSVKIYDVLGIEHPVSFAATPLTEGNLRLDVSGLPAGVYFVRVGGRMLKFVKL